MDERLISELAEADEGLDGEAEALMEQTLPGFKQSLQVDITNLSPANLLEHRRYLIEMRSGLERPLIEPGAPADKWPDIIGE